MTYRLDGHSRKIANPKVKLLSFAGISVLLVLLCFGQNNQSQGFQNGSLANSNRYNETKSINYLARVNASEVKLGDKVLDGSGVVIGIYDGGINVDNSAFKSDGQSQIVSQRCVGDSVEINGCNQDPNRAADNLCFTTQVGCFHGTAVAGFAAGQNKDVLLNGQMVNVGGVAPKSKISYVRQAMDSVGTIKYVDFVDALNSYVQDVKTNSPTAPDVINLSLSFPRDSYQNCEQNNEVKRAIDFLVSSGVIVVAASGNDGNKSQIAYPACMKNVIAVGSSGVSVDSNGNPSEAVSDFSNMSDEIDIVAPGEKQWGFMPEQDRYVSVSGTSFAAPIVTGSIALLKQAYPQLGTFEIEKILKDNSDPIIDPKTGKTYQKMNLGKSVATLAANPQLVQTQQQSPSVTSQSNSPIFNNSQAPGRDSVSNLSTARLIPGGAIFIVLTLIALLLAFSGLLIFVLKMRKSPKAVAPDYVIDLPYIEAKEQDSEIDRYKKDLIFD